MLRGLAHGRGRAVVIVTHDHRARAFGDRLIQIEDGQILDSPPRGPAHDDWLGCAPRPTALSGAGEGMRRATLFSIGLLMILGLAACFLMIHRQRGDQLHSEPRRNQPGRVGWGAAPGDCRARPRGARLRGDQSERRGERHAQAVPVEEGDAVRRGQLIARLVDSDYRARVHRAAAQVIHAEAELRRLLSGARDPERDEAPPVVREAEAAGGAGPRRDGAAPIALPDRRHRP